MVRSSLIMKYSLKHLLFAQLFAVNIQQFFTLTIKLNKTYNSFMEVMFPKYWITAMPWNMHIYNPRRNNHSLFDTLFCSDNIQNVIFEEKL